MRYQEFAVQYTTPGKRGRREVVITEFGADPAGAVRFRDAMLGRQREHHRPEDATLVAHTITITAWKAIR